MFRSPQPPQGARGSFVTPGGGGYSGPGMQFGSPHGMMQDGAHAGYGGGGMPMHGGADAYGMGYDGGHYGGGGMPGGYGHPGAFDMGGAASHTGVHDAARRWDMTNLMNKLTDMQLTVGHADESLSNKHGGGGFGGGGSVDGSMMYGMDGTGGAPGGAAGMDPAELAMAVDVASHVIGFDGGGMPMFSDMTAPDVDPSMLMQGEVMAKFTKRGTIMASRTWRQVHAVFEGTELVLYTPGTTKPELRFPLDASTEVSEGNPEKKHRNAKVKFDFEVRNESDEPLALSMESMDISQAWIESITYVVRKIRDAAWRVTLPLEELAHLVQVAQTGVLPGAQGEDGMGGDGMGGSQAGGEAGGMPPEVMQAVEDDAQSHTAYGSGLYEAVRGEPASFVIQANHANNVAKMDGADEFVVTVSSDDLHFDVPVMDNGDGTYTVEYTPTRSGEYELRVTCNNYDIFGSPFHPVVAKAPTSARNCAVTGEGMKVARTGVVNTFTITAKDKFDDVRSEGGDHFEITVTGAGIALPILDQGDGTYTVRYEVDASSDAYRDAVNNPRRPMLDLEVAICLVTDSAPYPRPIAGSPFHPRVVLPADEAPVVAAPPSQAYSRPVAASNGYAQHSPSAEAVAASEEIQRREAELAQRASELAAAAAAVEDAKRRVESDRADVDRQMVRMSELGRKVKHDSEKLAEQARTLRAMAASASTSPRPPPPSAPLPSLPASAPRAATRAAAALQRDVWNYDGPPADALPPAPVSPPTAAHYTSYASNTPAAPRAVAPVSPAPAAAGADAPAELYDPEVISLLDKYKRSLFALWHFYTSLSRVPEGVTDGSVPGMDMKRFVELFSDFDIAPTFMSKRELKAIYIAAAHAHASALPAAVVSAANTAARADASTAAAALLPLTYAAFVEALGRSALTALSKPAFQHLYPTALKKMHVLLEMWGMADPEKLSEISRRPRVTRDGAAAGNA